MRFIAYARLGVPNGGAPIVIVLVVSSSHKRTAVVLGPVRRLSIHLGLAHKGGR